MAVPIVKMAEQHIPAVMEIERLSNSAPWSETSFRREIENPQATYIVALQGDAVIGFSGYWSLVDEAHITTIAVHPDARGKGVGRALMAKMLSSAGETGMSCATLEVRAGNTAAIKLYENMGFVNSGVRKNYYPDNREDAIIMWRYGL